jgi:hypothetical protein
VYADLVFNHNSGADTQELNPIDGQWRWTKFAPMSQIPARLEMFSSVPARDLGRRNIR